MRNAPVKKHQDFVRFLAYVKPYTWYIVAAAGGGIVKFTVPLFVPQVFQYLLDDVLLSSTFTVDQKLQQALWWLGGLAAVFLLFWAPLVYVRHYYAGKAGHRSVFDLRCDLYYHILRMSASFFDQNKSGNIVSRLISDVQLAQNLVGQALTNIWMDMVSLGVVLFFLVRIDWRIALVSLATFPPYLYLFKKLRLKISDSSYQVQSSLADMSGNAQEKISGNRVVQAFVQEKREEQTFYETSEVLFASSMKQIFYQSVNMFATGTLVNISPLLVIGVSCYFVVQGLMTVGELVAAQMYLAALYMPLQRFSELNVIFANSMAALRRIFEVMDQQPDVRDAPDSVALERVQGQVEFQDVSFAYTEKSPVLKQISLTAAPGQKIALVGKSGSGKSTIISLIPRFYDITSGAILIDGQDIRRLKIRSLRQHISMVLQDPVLFSGTIRDNILYGNPKASKQELLDACRNANALEFILRMPDGFDTEVGEGGIFLSGGQRQRLTIARAFLKNPQILILDEVTSALDAESERLIQEALTRLMEQRTTFIIAHRLSTIVNADCILVLEDGQIVERGAHAELLQAKGQYYHFYRQQFDSAQDSFVMFAADEWRAGSEAQELAAD